MHIFFWYTEFFEALQWCPRNFSALCDRKNSTGKRDTPLFIHKTFRNQSFVKKSRIPSRSSSALWDKNFSTEFRDIPFLCIKFCDTRIFLKHRIVPQQNFWVLCDKIFPGRNVIPPTTHKIFRYQSFSGKQKCSFTKLFFPVLWHKKFWQNRDAPPPSYAWKFSN